MKKAEMVKRGAWRGAIVARSGARRAGEGGPAIGEGECEFLRENGEDGKKHGRPARRKTRRRVSYLPTRRRGRFWTSARNHQKFKPTITKTSKTAPPARWQIVA